MTEEIKSNTENDENEKVDVELDYTKIMYAELLINDALTKSFDNLIKLKLPVEKSAKLVKLTKILRNEYAKADIQKLEIYKKYGKRIKDETGQDTYTLDQASKEKKESFVKDFNELCAIKFETNLTGKISLPPTVELSAFDLLVLERFIEVN